MSLFSRPARDADLGQSIGPVRRAGIGVAIALFGGALIWASTIDLPSAVISSGVVRTQAPNHVIEHPDGGVVAKVNIAEGVAVSEGDLLIKLDDRRLADERAKLRREKLAAEIERARLIADLDGADALGLSDAAKTAIGTLAMDATADLEARRLTALRRARATLARTLETRMTGLDATLSSLEQRLTFEAEQATMAETRLIGLRKLNRRGRIADNDIEREEGAYLSLKASVAETGAEIARTRLERAEAELERDELPYRDRVEQLARIAELDRMIPDIALRIGQLDQAITRTEIRSPADGAAINVQVRALGGVVAPHEPVLEIVPDDDRFVLEMKVAPTDVDRVVEGMRAQITLSAFPQRLMPRVEGVVTLVSGDSTTSREDGSTHYLIWLKLDQESLGAAQVAVPFDIKLKPGMPVEAFVLTGENTLLGHLIDPFVRTFDRSFRDG